MVDRVVNSSNRKRTGSLGGWVCVQGLPPSLGHVVASSAFRGVYSSSGVNL